MTTREERYLQVQESLKHAIELIQEQIKTIQESRKKAEKYGRENKNYLELLHASTLISIETLYTWILGLYQTEVLFHVHIERIYKWIDVLKDTVNPEDRKKLEELETKVAKHDEVYGELKNVIESAKKKFSEGEEKAKKTGFYV